MPPAAPILLHLGGGPLQLPTLRWARAQGLEVVLTDADEGAPGRALCDRFHRIGGTDVPALVALARDLAGEGRFAGAFCNNDYGLIALAEIGAATRTPHVPREAVERALDKLAAKETWRDREVPTPEWFEAATPAEARAAAVAFGGPAIVKPVDASGSRGVAAISGADQAEAAWHAAREHGRTILVERLARGRHLDVNGLFLDGVFHPAGILDRVFSDPPACVPIFGTQPASLGIGDASAAYDLLEVATRALGISVGPVKADVILEPAGATLLEVAPRFHGEVSTAHVTPLCFGVSPIELWLAHLAGRPARPSYRADLAQGVAGWHAILPARGGRFVALEGQDEARALPGIVDLLVTRRPGATLPAPDDNRAVCGFLWARGATRAEVEATLRTARRRLDVIVE
jgi:biotin carboxylase